MSKRVSLTGSDELFRDTRRPLPAQAPEGDSEGQQAEGTPPQPPRSAAPARLAHVRLDEAEMELMLRAIRQAKFPTGQASKLPISAYEQFEALRLKLVDAEKEAFGA